MDLDRTVRALLLIGATGVASAQGATDWTGWYLGMNAGYGFGKSNVTTSTVYSASGYFAQSSVDSVNASGRGSVKPKGALGGLTFGYNAQQGDLVFGFESDADAAGLKGDRSTTVVYPGFAPTAYTLDQSTKIVGLETLRGRIGYADGANLWFATLGLAGASIKIEDTFSDTFAGASERVSKSKDKLGWTIGGGYARAMPNQWSFKAEILYADFGKVTTGGGTLTAYGSSTAYPSNVFTHTADFKGGMVRVGFDYRF